MTNLLIRLLVKDWQNLKDPAVHGRYGRAAGAVGLFCNLLLAAAKLVAGLASGSIAIMADAVNNISDAASSVITLVGFKLSQKPADEEHPFGHARFEYIAGLAVSVMVLVVGIELGKSSIEKIITPQPVSYGWLSLAILAASILVKLWMAGFNRSIGKRIGSATLQATFADSRNDVITTSAVLAAALIARFTGLNLDGWMGAGVALFILISGIGLVKETLDPLLGAAPDPALVQMLNDKIKSYPGVLGTHDLIVHDYGPGRRFASAHVEMSSEDDVMRSHEVIDAIEKDVFAQDHISLIIHYDPVAAAGTASGGIRKLVEAKVRDIDPRLSIHDLDISEKDGAVEYCFDVVAPEDFTLGDEELQSRITAALQHGHRPVKVRLTVDRSYAPIPKQ